MTTALLVLRLALRSLVAHRVKSAVVGGLLFAGTFAVVFGNALLDSVEASMQRVVTRSLTGDLQVYAADARDALSLFGGAGLGSTEIGEIDRFEDVRAALDGVEGVSDVIPMGVTSATVFGRNDIDQLLADLRAAVRAGDGERVALLEGRVRRIVRDLDAQADVAEALADAEVQAREAEALAHVDDDAFWVPFAGDDLQAALAQVDYLDARIAPLAADGRLLYLRVVGTDPAAFARVFDRFRIVLGEPIPPGKPGFLFSHRTYERLIKLQVAATLDRAAEAVADGGSIADDPLLRDQVTRNVKQYRRITYQLDQQEAAELEAWLHQQLPDVQGGLDDLVQAWLDVDDSNVVERVAGFYAEIAPRIQLYEVPVGGTITLRGFTKSGFLRAVEVPVYGTYEFAGLEEAGLQSATNLVDLVTFRELYGKMSDRARDELAQIRDSVGVAEVDRASAEDALFGGGAEPVEAEASTSAGIDVDIDAVRATDPFARTYPVEDLEQGLALDAAVIFEDGAPVREVTERVRAAVAPLGLQVVDWKAASGLLGQFITVVRVVLLVALGIIFLVALIIVNNAMVMATIDRVPEIGTLRAIGAQRGTVLGLFLTETALLGLIAGGAGALCAVASVLVLGRVGIPADAEILVLLFGGPRLYPSVGLDDVAFGLLAITSVAVVSTVYPAILAARVPPVVAMQGRE
ncbi:MAG: FtsX-like permease family protein [Myxococcota bacterium]